MEAQLSLAVGMNIDFSGLDLKSRPLGQLTELVLGQPGACKLIVYQVPDLQAPYHYVNMVRLWRPAAKPKKCHLWLTIRRAWCQVCGRRGARTAARG
jgi:hypothetical protein